MSHIFEGLVGPLMQQLETRLSNNEQRLTALREEKERLKAELKMPPAHIDTVKSTVLDSLKSTAV